MTSLSAPAQALLSLSEADLIAALSQDPDFFKRAQKAMLEAKRQEAERRRAEELANQGVGIDPKIYAKAASMVQGPFNDQNNLELRSLLEGSNLNSAPSGSPSLLTLSLDYLATKQRVELAWPAILVSLGAAAGEPEMSSLQKLYAQRFHSLDGLSNQLPGLILSRKGPWKEIEEKLNFPLAAFLERVCGRSSLWNAKAWTAMRNLAEAGCQCPPPATAGNPDFWQTLSDKQMPALDPAKPALRSKAAEARREAFEAMINAGWVSRGVTNLSDSLRVSLDAQHGGYIDVAPSMAFLRTGALDETTVDLFSMLCEAEIKANTFHRYDDVGRSRLFFANERLRGAQDNGAALTLLALAQACLERGDSPESVNPQNPVARAANKQMGGMLASWMERSEILGVSSASTPAAPVARPASRL